MNVDQFLSRLRTAAGSLPPRQIVALVAAFLAVVALVLGSAYWVNAPSYTVLFGELDAESAASVVAKLKSQKIPYTLDDGGRTIRVASDKVDELRLEYASQGMPASGRIGFEIFDRTAFGVTDFLEHVNYRRALEGELARTISTISEVAGARVHIAIPQPSLFTGRDQPAKASVVLKLRNNRQLPPATAAAIAGLVAASVESLKPESVVILDNQGRHLSTNAVEAAGGADGLPLERQQKIEHEMAARVVALLEPIVGADRVRVNVSAKLTGNTAEETEERWNPTTVVRSHRIVTQTAAGAGVAAQGVAGARANLPPDASKKAEAAAAVPVAAPQSAHTAETTNYEVSKLTRHTVQPRGEIARLSVAVVLDDDRAPGGDGGKAQAKPRSAADIQKIHDLVAASVGLNPGRGDQLTVENIAFEDPEVPPVAAPSVWQRFEPQAFAAGRILAVVAIAAFALFGVIRPLVHRSLAALPAGAAGAAAASAPRTIKELEAEIDGQLQTAAAGAQGRMPVLTRRVAALTQREPENAARLLRTWLTEDER